MNSLDTQTRGQIVLVDEHDHVLGFEEKFKGHKTPVPLHRAISVVIFDSAEKKMLLQQRAEIKPTWPLFWTNACCTHPVKDESYLNAALRRLPEEMGFSTKLTESFRFTYEAKYDDIWGEHEYDVVFVGNYEGTFVPNPEEVKAYRWTEIDELHRDVEKNAGLYTPWFKLILRRLFSN